uniref:Uncharacterized protein n=1 Tax=Vannella robusta TaxID=1487602 RepID=A0A7S4M9K9_9EUKA|mmetsp:Transcript_15948/g.20332  ORF Transcript_15948/g.20332 Transcript_15948/m.20332 type:complete len:924 (+) Transcript_15948:137-2908(+)
MWSNSDNHHSSHPKPENIPGNFSISPDDPEVANTPGRSVASFSDFDYEAELSSILQTPPSGDKNATLPQQVRKTPGAEITDQTKHSARSEEMNSQFQILQALQNLKLSTEPTSFETAQSSAYNLPVRREAVSIPFSDQYSLWGHPNPNYRFEPSAAPCEPSRGPEVSTDSYRASNTGGSYEVSSYHPAMLSGPPILPFVPSTSNSNEYARNMNAYPPNHHNNGNQGQMYPHPSNFYPSGPPMARGSHMNTMNHTSYSRPNGAHDNARIHSNAALNEAQGFCPSSELLKGKNPNSYAPRPSMPVTISSKKPEHYQTHRRQASSGSPKMESQAPVISHRRSASTSTEHPIARKEDKEAPSGKDPGDSPTSNTKFKQFYRSFKQKEKEGYKEASQYAIEHLEILPEKVHWRVFLELADLAKRENRISKAREYYEQVNKLQPTAAQGWLEYAKMEEECGNLAACKSILSSGLSHCTVNESLMVKCLKHYERMDHLQEARALLGALKDVPVERTWRTIMEGGLLEARQGNLVVARQVFHYLIRSVPWYGPIYQEACRFEEKCEEHENAIKFVEAGLAENPRYGPLWFSALRLNEKLAENGDVSAMHETIERAVKSISKELIWKLYFEAAQIEERAGNIQESREFYVKSVSYCPENLLWKVWMGGARTELNYDNIDIARKLLKRALKEVPPKMKAMVLLECCRLEEYAHQLDKAREILTKAKKYTKHEWKVFLESVLLEMRANNLERAIEEAREALLIHTGTGRLWAVMIQLKQSQGIEAQMKVFRTALSEVPKSGEVWCEGARIALQQKDFAAARKYINFAIQFTPQYGDSFIEYLRLEILEKGEDANLEAVEQACVNADPNYGALWLHCKKNPLDSTRNVVREAIRLLNTPQSASDEVPAVAALMVNDIYQNVHQRSNEERRKAIFL